MSSSGTKGKPPSHVGKAVSFGPPGDVARKGGKPLSGMIIDEVWVDPELHEPGSGQTRLGLEWGDYAFCAQLIRWENEAKEIRLAYYRRRTGEDHWEFASQTTVCAEPATIKKLCEVTLAQVSWFDAEA